MKTIKVYYNDVTPDEIYYTEEELRDSINKYLESDDIAAAMNEIGLMEVFESLLSPERSSAMYEKILEVAEQLFRDFYCRKILIEVEENDEN